MTVTVQGPERNIVITRNITRTIAVQSSGVSNLVGTVRYDVAQSMTSPEKLQAWANITGIPLGLSVDSASPTLTLTQIGAGLALYTTGGITAGAFAGPLTGNASSATVLATPRAINGVSFDGSAAITVTAAAGTLTGSTLNATVTGSSLTTVGTLVSLAVTGAVSAGSFAGPLTGNVTGDVSGNSGTVTNGVYTSGSYADPAWITSLAGSKVTGAIAGTAAAGTLTGATLAANVLASSLTSVGTLGSLAVTGAVTAGSFAGPLTGNVTGNVSGSSGSTTGNAATATALQTARAINGVNFDGTGAITITAAAGTLTGTTLNATVTASSLTSLGTLSSLAVGGAQTITLNSASAGLTITQSGAGAALSTNGQIVSTLATGTAPFSVASTTAVANLNASLLGGATFAAPGTIGGGTPGAATFTTLTATGQVSLGGAAGAEGLRVSTTASAVNYARVQGAATGGIVYVGTQGSDTNAPFAVYSKGTSYVGVFTNGGSNTTAVFRHTASSVNWIDFYGSTAGNAVATNPEGSDTNIGLQASTKGTGPFRVFSHAYTAEQFRVVAVASAVNFVTVQGGVAANSPILYTVGSDTNSSLLFSSKGSGSIGFYTNTTASPVAIFAHTASAVNYWQFYGAAAGGALAMYAGGTDTDIAVVTSSKGTGLHIFRGHSGLTNQFVVHPVANAVNYLRAIGAPTGSGPSMYADGTDTNVNYNHSLKGAGAHFFFTGSTSVVQLTVSHTASAVNRLDITGSATGNAIAISTVGTDSNRSITFTTAGTGTVRFNNKIYPGTPAAATQTAAGISGGTGAPSNADASDGDFYFRSDGGALTSIYHKRAGAWVGIV